MKEKVYWSRNSLSAAVSLALTTVFSAQAQEPVEDEEEAEGPRVIEEVLVSSFRRSLQNSIDLKASETSIVEAVSAEEIGKLPDVSIAESLARLPGLAAQRLNGRGQVISVRGLAPDFTTALLNGRPQVSTGDNRGVEFDQYPSELLSSVVVYKTPDASLIGQGLAGTADLRTIRPLTYGERAIAGNIRYEQNQQDALNAGSTDDGVRYSFSYVDQFADDTIGVAIGFAHMTNPSQEKRYDARGYDELSGVSLPLSDPMDPLSELTPADFGLNDDDLVVSLNKSFVRSSELDRDGLIGVLEWQPNDQFSTSVDVYASDFSEEQLLRGIEFALGSPQPGAATFFEPESASNGVVTAGTFHNVKGVVRNDVNFRDSELRAIGWDVDYDINDKWRAGIDVSYSEVKRKDMLLETYAGTGPRDEFADDGDGGPLDTLVFSSSGDAGSTIIPTLDYTDTSLIRLTSPHGWGNNFIDGGQVGYTNNPRIQDELMHFTVRAERFFNSNNVSSLEFGLNVNERIKSLVADEFFLGLTSGDFEAPLVSTNGITDLSFLGIPGMVSYDPLEALNSGLYSIVRNDGTDVVRKSWAVEEEVTIGYVQLNIDAQNFRLPFADNVRLPLTGNIGVQVVRTDQSSDAFGSVPNAPGFLSGILTVPVSSGRDFTLTLPSFNLTWEVGDEKFLRLGAARTLARARMDELKASSVINFNESAPCADANNPITAPTCDPNDLNDSPWSSSSGNPQLDPWIADSIDISYEMYFPDDLGYFAVAGFYKDLESYIFDQDLSADFSAFPTGDFETLTDIGRVEQPANGSGGVVKGVELAFSYNFDNLWPAIRGLGVFLSAAFNDSSIIQDPEDPSLPLPGLSEEVRNITVYYERGGFSTRVSNRYRSTFLGEVAGFGAGRELTQVEEESVVDAQIGYSWSSGPLNGVSVFLQGNNLTDEPFRTYFDNDPRQVKDYQRYGRTFMLGASYKY
ncbi:MAG: TonB-dependent receptor [Gammaproteobacteria bacterium]|nr:TonB-dependent receptor [Gammaproteobacteria bacterium]MDH3767311.1 TonB-dependent receptor [Gammaproteobacteria bacterium]